MYHTKCIIKTLLKLIATALIVWLYFSLTSCYTQKKCVEKFCKADTITIHDTIRTESVQTDTIFSVQVDSITIIKDKLKVVYKRIHDSVYISGECAGDTIYYTRQVPVFHPEQTMWQKAIDLKMWLLVLLFVGIVIGLVLRNK
jgi:hypothetical protein